jgi:hypothetical protein
VEKQAHLGYRLGERGMLPVEMELAAAKRIGAVMTTLPTCHMVILQEPPEVAAVIDEAARKVNAKQKYELLSRIQRPKENRMFQQIMYE